MKSFRALCLYLILVKANLAYTESSSVQKVDVVVLGGGAAGLTSAIYLGRAGFETLVLEGPVPGGAITQSMNVHNWPGYKDKSGIELMDEIRSQAEVNGAILSREEVLEIDLSKRPFSLTVQDVYDSSKKRTLLADACIVALGSSAKKLEVPGESKYWSRGVYSCAVCDGALYKGKDVVVVGGGDAALLEAEYLSGLAKKVYVLNRKNGFKGVEKTRREKILEAPNVEILYETRIKEIKGNGEFLNSITFLDKENNEKNLSVDAVFVAIGSIPNTHFFVKQLDLDEKGYIALKKGCETSVPGIFAAGDIADPIFKQAVIASGEGAKAAMQATDYLRAYGAKKRESLAVKISKKQEDFDQVIEITSIAQLKELVSTSEKNVLVDFYATWCGPCRYLGQFTDQWAKDLRGKAIFCKVNVDKVPELVSRYKIYSMPTVVVINQQGLEVARKTGVDEIVKYVNLIKDRH